jgi:hypothetical protein
MPTNETSIRVASLGAGFHAYPRLSEIRNVKRAGTEACPYEWFVRFMMATKRIRQPRADTEVVPYAEIFWCQHIRLRMSNFPSIPVAFRMFDVHSAAILTKLDFYRCVQCESNFVRSRLIKNEKIRDIGRTFALL